MKKLLTILILTFALPVFSQEVFEDVLIEPTPAPAPPEGPPLPPDTFIFLSHGFGAMEEPVKGAPYSAEAVTERTQYLSDGNRIFQKTSALIYRDGMGRTRREESIDQLGFWAADQPRTTVMIHDPVAGERYVLNVEEKTAHKMKSSGKGAAIFERRTPPPGEGGPEKPVIQKRFMTRELPPPPDGPHPPHAMRLPPFTGEAKTESLGKKTIEGVQAEGTRTITTIEAGKIGNERAIEIVSEKWYSPDLKVNILTKHNDPRFGETIYRLTKIKNVEPDALLFKVPQDYKIVNGMKEVD